MRPMSLFIAALVIAVVFVAGPVRAQSVADFPTGWETWPEHHSGSIPPKGAAIPKDLHEAFQSTFRAYNWLNDGKGAGYVIRMAPSIIGVEREKLPDGPTGVLEIPSLGFLLVTEHRDGKPVYGAYTFEGADISTAHPTVSAKFCNACHDSYPDVCVNGVCNLNRR